MAQGPKNNWVSRALSVAFVLVLLEIFTAVGSGIGGGRVVGHDHVPPRPDQQAVWNGLQASTVRYDVFERIRIDRVLPAKAADPEKF
jgi:hypothetical protein